MGKHFKLWLIFCCMVNCHFHHPSGEKLIILRNTHVEVGIIPDLGGRVVLLRQPGMNNILKSDPRQWDDPKVRPEVSAFSDFVAFNGHIVWLSPQSEWWIKQDINRERRQSKSIWPPDPYLIYGQFHVVEQTDTSLTMIGPASPVSGVQLTKRIWLNSDGIVTFEAMARNIREQPIGWGLWFNTRLDGFARCYVPADEDDLIKLAVKGDGIELPLPFDFCQGYFTFLPPALNDPSHKYVQKAFIAPSAPFMVGFSAGQAITIRFDWVARETIHADQAPVEIYNLVSASETLLEMEIHGPYQKIQPGESIRLTETWQLFTYDGPSTPDAHLAFINKKIKGAD